MASTVAAIEVALKDVYTQDTLEKQIYDSDEFLKELERKTPTKVIGDEALTPLQTAETGGYSVVGAAGSSSLNPPSNATLAEAKWKWTGHWMQIKLDHMAMEQSSDKARAIVENVELEVDSATTQLSRQLTRQAWMDGTALIAKCTTTTSSTTINLDPDGLGFHAIRQGWLQPGLTVDIGTTSAETDVVGDVTITGVKESETDPEITISGSPVSTDGNDYVSIANARAGTTSLESNGLRNLVSATDTVGNINPATYTFWQAHVDSTTESATLDDLLTGQRVIRQKGGKADLGWTSLKQQQHVYGLLQNQVRFSGDKGFAVGNQEGIRVGDCILKAHPDCPDSDLYWLQSKALFALRVKPTWVSQGRERNILQWVPNSTFVQGGMVAYHQLALNRRNVHYRYSNLS